VAICAASGVLLPPWMSWWKSDGAIRRQRLKQQDKAGAMHVAAGRGDAGKQVLEDGLELESEQHLHAHDQQARFIERRLESLSDRHCARTLYKKPLFGREFLLRRSFSGAVIDSA
jgi:hypothetical protein